MEIPDAIIGQIYAYHTNNDFGKYTWAQLVESEEWREIVGSVRMTGEAFRKRVARWKKRSEHKLRYNSKYDSELDLDLNLELNLERTLSRNTAYNPEIFVYAQAVASNEDGNKQLEHAVDYTTKLDAIEDTMTTMSIDTSNPSNIDTKLEMYQLRLQLQEMRDLLASGQRRHIDDPLLYEPYPDHLDDTDKWIAYQEALKTEKSIGTVLIASDLHFPDENTVAIRLFLKLLAYLQPDVLLLNGDIFDFDSLSTFAKHRRRRHQDALMEVESHFHSLIDQVCLLVPHITVVAQKGNHDDRFDRWNDLAGNPFADTTEEVFVNMIRSNKRVWWLGQKQETNFGQLLIQHGKRTGDYAAKNANKDAGYALSVVQGHNHRPATYIHRVHDSASDLGAYRVVKAVSSGTLCNIPPHYQRDSNQSKWLNGVAYATVNLDGKDVDVQNIVFHRRADGILWCVMGKDVFFSTDAKGKHIE